MNLKNNRSSYRKYQFHIIIICLSDDLRTLTAIPPDAHSDTSRHKSGNDGMTTARQIKPDCPAIKTVPQDFRQTIGHKKASAYGGRHLYFIDFLYSKGDIPACSLKYLPRND